MLFKQTARKLLCAAALLCLLIPAAWAGQEEPIVILHTNDIHCQVDQTFNEDGSVSSIGYVGVAAYKSQLQEQHGTDRVLLVDAGDAIQGGPMGTLTDGAYIVDLMNQVGYDLAVPGNHEFDYGMENFLTLATQRASFPYLSSNFIDLTTGARLLDGYKLFSFGDIDVAFVGVSTPETTTSSTPTHFMNQRGEFIYSFCLDDSPATFYNTVQNCVNAARNQGADYVIAVAHLGTDLSSSPWTSRELVENTRGIDALIDGHSHSTFTQTISNLDGDPVVMAQTGTKLENLGKLTIYPETGEIQAELVPNYAQQDPDTAAYLSRLRAEFDGMLRQVVGRSEVHLTTADPRTGLRAVRTAGTNMGNFCADAYRAVLGTDIAFVNGGGVRADITPGDVTYEDLINIHPFGNELCVMEVSGAAVWQALEVGARELPYENGGFLQVSGLSFTINTAIPSPAVLDSFERFLGLDGPHRVTDVMVNGKPLDPQATYTLAASDYMLLKGGDGMSMFSDSKLLQNCVMLDNAALMNYLSHHLGGCIGQEYADPYGSSRITIIHDPSALQTAPEYTVLPGDSLWSIAAAHLGKGIRWSELYQLNRDILSDPGLIYPGQTLKLPA